MQRPERHAAIFDLIFRVDDVEKLQPLVRTHGAIVDQQRVAGFAQRNAHLYEHAGGQQANAFLRLRILEYAAEGDRSGERIDCIVDEVDVPLVRKPLFALQAHQDLYFFRVADRLQLALVDHIAHSQHGALVDVEVGVHGVERHDRGEQRLILGDQVAQRVVIATDFAVDRRGNFAKFAVQLIRFQRRLRGGHLGRGLFLGGLILVQVLLADGAGSLGDHLGPGVVGLRQLELGLVEFDVGFRLIELGLVGAGVDLEQQIAGLELVALFERHLHQVAGDARPNVDCVDGFGSPGVIDIVDDFSLQRMADRNEWRLVLDGLGRFAAQLHHGRRKDQQQNSAQNHRKLISGAGFRVVDWVGGHQPVVMVLDSDSRTFKHSCARSKRCEAAGAANN